MRYGCLQELAVSTEEWEISALWEQRAEKREPRHQAQTERTFCHVPIFPGIQVGTGISSGCLGFAFPLTLQKMMMMMVITLEELRALHTFFLFFMAKGSDMHQEPAAHCGSCTAFGTELLL